MLAWASCHDPSLVLSGIITLAKSAVAPRMSEVIKRHVGGLAGTGNVTLFSDVGYRPVTTVKVYQ